MAEKTPEQKKAAEDKKALEGKVKVLEAENDKSKKLIDAGSERTDALEVRVKALEDRAEAHEKAFEDADKKIQVLEEAPAQAEPKPVGEALEVEDSETFRYSKQHPKGKKFKTSEIDKLGPEWKDSPAKLK